MPEQQKSDIPANVQDVFAGYRDDLQARLYSLREMIITVAAQTPGVGDLEETLKWGQPAYLTRSKSGSTIRIDVHDEAASEIALYVHCQTKLVETFQQRYPEQFRYDGTRALIFTPDDNLDTDALRDCIGLALTYHRWK